MTTSLYELTVPNYLQILAGVSGVLAKGAAHFESTGMNADDFVAVRLHDDMLPFQFQIASVAHHSLGAIEGLKAGQFSPSGAMHPQSYADLQKMIADTTAALQALTADEVNALSGKDMAFVMGTMRMPFTAEGFIHSFSMPNFYFHAATAYDILRTNGVKLGKRDFLGAMRMKA